MIGLVAAGVGAMGLAGLGTLRVREALRRDTAWATLRSRTPWRDEAISADGLATGAPAADRLLRFLIPGPARLRTVAEVASVGGRAAAGPTWREIVIVAPPYGFASRRFGRWGLSESTTLLEGAAAQARWVLGLAPLRLPAAEAPWLAARAVGSALLWAPGGLLPGPTVRWAEIDRDTARATVVWLGQEMSVDVAVEADGRPSRVAGAGWSARPTAFFKQDGYRLAAALDEELGGVTHQRQVVSVRHPGPWIGSSHA